MSVGKASIFMKLVNFKIISLVIVTYCLTLVALTPLSWVVPYLEGQLSQYGVKLENPRGTLWQGESLVKVQRLGEANLTWDVQALGLFLLKLPVDFEVQNKDLDVNGQLTASIGGLAVSQLSGYLDETAFETIYTSYRANLSGRLQLQDVNANMTWSQELGDASGQLTWSGGPVSLPVGRSVESFDVPTIYGVLTSDDQQWLLRARGSAQQTYLDASVTREGIATLSIKRELASDMSIPIPGSGASLFDVSQKVF